MPSRGRSADVLWEREEELAALDDALTSAANGAGSGRVLMGEAGIGKSALLGWARRRAATDGFIVLSAAGGTLEREYGFGVALQLLGALAQDPAQRAVLLHGAGAGAAPVLAPDQAVVRAPDASFAVLYGLFWAVANLAAQRPVLICIDDAQWSDDPSLLFASFLARRLEELPVALLIAVRTGEEPRPALEELSSGGDLPRLDPAPLSSRGVLELTRAAFGSTVEASFAAACHARTGGNPLFATELLRALAEQQVSPTAAEAETLIRAAPAAVGRLVLARVTRLGPGALELARAVAVLGDDVTLRDAAALAAQSTEAAGRAAERLTAAGIFGDRPELGFAHPLMRDAVNLDLSPAGLAERHSRAARVLDAHDRRAELIAAQLLASPPAADARAVLRLREAAQDAVGHGAPEEAVRLLTRAIAEPPAPELAHQVLFELGLAEAAAWRPTALARLQSALAAAPDAATRAQVAVALGGMLVFARRWSEVYDVIGDAQAELGDTDRELSLTLETLSLTARTMDPAAGRLTASRTAELVRLPGTSAAECALLAGVAFELGKAAHPTKAVLAIADRAIAGGAGRLATTSALPAPLMLSTILQWTGEIGRSYELSSGLLDEARGASSPFLFAEVSASRAMTAWRGGDLDGSEADVRQGLAAAGPVAAMVSPVGTSALIRVLTDRGAFAEALACAEAATEPEGEPASVSTEIIATSLGRLEVAMGRHQAALARLTAGGELVEAAGTVNAAASGWRVHACEALVGLGRREEAAEMLAPALAAARRSGGQCELGLTLRAAALTTVPAEVDLLRESCDRLGASELRLEHARSLVELGAALRRAGHRRDARGPLAEGMEIAHRRGAVPLAERAREELLSAGARPRRVERTGLDSLTPSERRAARLAADGLANREIAQQLFVSTRTVESQLRSAYGKLGVSSRRDLAGALAPPADRPAG